MNFRGKKYPDNYSGTLKPAPKKGGIGYRAWGGKIVKFKYNPAKSRREGKAIMNIFKK